MRRVRGVRTGFSLLEVVVSLLLLAVGVWGMLALYVGMLVNTRQADRTQKATAALDTVLACSEVLSRRRWPPTAPPDLPSRYSGSFQEYVYEVSDSGRLPDPMDTTGRTYLEMRQLEVTLFFYDPETLERKTKHAILAVSR